MGDWLEISLRLGLATLAGILLGANRWLHHKSAGVKTHALVSIGAALAMLIVVPANPSQGALANISTDVASRVLQGLITGIGFLGAGVIIHNARGKRIQGLTTAASIWITTLLGAAIGSGRLILGSIAIAATGLVLLLGNSIERFVDQKFGHHAKAGSDEDAP
ncbi:MAG: MgtC/SapB family protein [Betaproteobacteria bacterium]|nr:MgtC/SapB family protein [Betaproteobacteria bacterium]